LKYLGYTTACDIMFGFFVVSWFLARHVAYLMICWSIRFQSLTIVSEACYVGVGKDMTGPFPIPNNWSFLLEPFYKPQGQICLTANILWGFLTCLMVLQAITLAWFCLIVKLVVKVLRGGNADDPRSGDEAEEEEEFEYEEARPLEEEVGVEALDLKNWERRAGVKRTATTSSVSLPGHSDRKELLGRIGCEKQVD
jgi:very-long-chain ceramide synthase